MEAIARGFGAAVEVTGVLKQATTVGNMPVIRAVYPTGWRHSDHLAEPCGDTHVGYCVSGRLRVWWPDGREVVVEGGQAFALPPGHDAACDDECTLIQFDGGASAARP